MKCLTDLISEGYRNMIGRVTDFSRALEKAERDIYVKAYKYCKLNQTSTAKALGVSRGTFITKMKKWGELK